MTYRVPKLMGMSLLMPLMKDWKGSTPKAAILNIATLTAPVMTPRIDIMILFFMFSSLF